MKLRSKVLLTLLMALFTGQCYAWMATGAFWSGIVSAVVGTLLGTAVNANNKLCTDGQISDIAQGSSNRIIISGWFSNIGVCTNGTFPFNLSTGALNIPSANALTITGLEPTVAATLPDGSGGWYIGGGFTSIGGTTRNHIAKLNADGTLNAWNPNIDGPVYSLVLSGTTLYAGGSFSTVGGTTRNNVAGINTSTGAVTTWNPNANGMVMNLGLISNTVYLSGIFGKIGATTRNYLAAVTTAGTLTSWNPNPNSNPQSLTTDGSNPLAGIVMLTGNFSIIGGQIRNGAAIYTNNAIALFNISPTDASLSSMLIWPPMGSGSAVTPSIYVAGPFSTVGAYSRIGIANIDFSGNVTSYQPDMSSFGSANVLGMTVQTSNLYVLGTFSDNTVYKVSYLQSFNAQTGEHNTSFTPNYAIPNMLMMSIYGPLSRLSSTSTSIMVPGITMANAVPRNNIAAIDTDSGAVTSWDPNADFIVTKAIPTSTTVYVIGYFTSIGGETRPNGIAGIDITTGAPTSFSPGLDGTVNDMNLVGNNLYMIGNFTDADGSARNGIAAYDITTNTVTSFNPTLDAAPSLLTSYGTTLYTQGAFTTVNGSARNGFAAFSTATGALTGWNPPAQDNGVNAIKSDGTNVYIGGTFAHMGATARNYVASVDASSGALTSWAPVLDGSISNINVDASNVYLGGGFQNVNGTPTGCFAITNKTTGASTSFAATCDGGMYGFSTGGPMLPLGTNVYIGGSYSLLNGLPRGGYSVLNASTGALVY